MSHSDTAPLVIELTERPFSDSLLFVVTNVLTFVSVWLVVLLMPFMLFEIGYIIWRKREKKSIKRHLWILFITFIVFVLMVLWRWIISFGHGDPMF